MIVVVGALEKAFGVKELVVASYQAASGAGQGGIDALHEQIDAVAGKNLGS
jgi:aspartate-semialdehyde dehydrogenase